MKKTPLFISATALFGSLLAGSTAFAATGIITSGEGEWDKTVLSYGSQGWNMGNVAIKYFDANGAAVDTLPEDGSYESYIYKSIAKDTAPLGIVVAKNPPVGDPPGIKIVNNDHNKDGAVNCLISTAYVDENPLVEIADYSNQLPVLCSSDFQTHKRYKALMLPEMVKGGAGAEESLDLVFNVEAYTPPEPTDPNAPRSYVVYQKINNWTDSRLAGYKLEVGFGIGNEFIRATTDNNVSFNITDNSYFSHGLFGPADDEHFPTDGFFSVELAGYTTAGESLTSSDDVTTPTSKSEYATFADGAWLPAAWVPTGIFYDEDHNPDTDAVLMAYWGKDTNDGAYKWLYGQMTAYSDELRPNAVSFDPVPTEKLAEWAADEWYSIDKIDDFANLNLNYAVNVGDPAGFLSPYSTFTIRVTPLKAADADNTLPEFMEPDNQPPTVIYEEESNDEENNDDTTPTTPDEEEGGGGGGSFNPLALLMLIPVAGAYLRRKFK